MQDRGADGFPVEVHLRQFLGDGDRVRDIGFSRFPCLALVRDGTELIGLEDLRNLLIGKIGLEGVDQLAHAMIPARDAR